mgnify:CR=1 FL=1
MEYTSASQAGVIVSCLPIIVALMAFFMLKEYISKAIVIGFTLCIGGSILLTLLSPSTDQAPNPLLGNFLELMAMVCAAFYTVSIKHLAILKKINRERLRSILGEKPLKSRELFFVN